MLKTLFELWICWKKGEHSPLPYGHHRRKWAKITSATCCLHRVQGHILKIYVIFHDIPQQVAVVVLIQEPLLNIQFIFTFVNKLMQ